MPSALEVLLAGAIGYIMFSIGWLARGRWEQYVSGLKMHDTSIVFSATSD